MTHEEFMNLYDDSLRHGWVTSKEPSKAAEQKKREQEYNKEYYQKHKDNWKEYNGTYKTADGSSVDVYGVRGNTLSNAKAKLDIAINNANLDSANNEKKKKEGWEFNGTYRTEDGTEIDQYGLPGNFVSNTMAKANATFSQLRANPSIQAKMDRAKNKVRTVIAKLTNSPKTTALTTSSEKRTYVNGHLMTSEKGDYTKQLLEDYSKVTKKKR